MTKTLSQLVANKLYSRIVNGGVYSAGSRLPGENELSAELGVSRTTLREAIKILSSQGVLEVYRGRGTFVAADFQQPGRLELSEANLHKARIKDLLEARMLFEPAVTAIACSRANQAEIENILTLGKKAEEALLTGKDRIESDQEFHRAILAASHNEFLLELLPIIYRSVEETLSLAKHGDDLAQNTLRDHDEIMNFIKERDAEGAKSAMRVHLHRAIYTLGLNDLDDPI